MGQMAGARQSGKNKGFARFARFASAAAVAIAALACPARDARADADAGAGAIDELPAGAPIAYGARPKVAGSSREARAACSFRHPICAHGDEPRATLAALDAAERAWDVTTGALDLPAPDVDVDSGAFDVYVAPSAGARAPSSRRATLARGLIARARSSSSTRAPSPRRARSTPR